MRRILIVLFIVAFTPCIAQSSDSLAFTPKLAVKWIPFSLFGRFPTAQFGLEYRLNRSNPHWTMSHEAGLIVKGENDTESFSNKSGFKALTELRYYVFPTHRAPFYLSTELYYHQIKYTRAAYVGYECQDGCNYYQYFSWRRNYIMQRGALKFGVMIFLDPAERLLLDLSAGIGYRIRRSEDIDKAAAPPNSINFTPYTTWFETKLDEDDETITSVFSFRFGFRIK